MMATVVVSSDSTQAVTVSGSAAARAAMSRRTYPWGSTGNGGVMSTRAAPALMRDLRALQRAAFGRLCAEGSRLRPGDGTIADKPPSLVTGSQSGGLA